MKLTVLVDNNTYIDQYYLGEPGVSFYIESQNKKVLFDTGYSHIFKENAKKMGIDLSTLDYIVLSHGHNDHTLGLVHLESIKASLLAHPDVCIPKYKHNEYIGMPYSKSELEQKWECNFSKEPYWITSELVYLGEIPRVTSFENKQPIGYQVMDNQCVEDYLFDDSALAYKTSEGIYVITGCSHSGICNMIEYAKKVCNDTRILGVIGGFHMFDLNEQSMNTIAYFKENQIASLYPCHCVSLKVKAEMMRSLPVHEVGVGLQIEW
ncbi:MAG: MBL fold metallo-hydrolase [Erysipelotrichaceae bacterium]|nr:MBL fold metallo-hydrolase [Erysipelotrichaceae bacterium]